MMNEIAEREKRLALLERSILAELRPEALEILGRAFSVWHGRQAINEWENWIGKALACPVSDLDIDRIHHAEMLKAGMK